MTPINKFIRGILPMERKILLEHLTPVTTLGASTEAWVTTIQWHEVPFYEPNEHATILVAKVITVLAKWEPPVGLLTSKCGFIKQNGKVSKPTQRMLPLRAIHQVGTIVQFRALVTSFSKTPAVLCTLQPHMFGFEYKITGTYYKAWTKGRIGTDSRGSHTLLKRCRKSSDVIQATIQCEMWRHGTKGAWMKRTGQEHPKGDIHRKKHRDDDQIWIHVERSLRSSKRRKILHQVNIKQNVTLTISTVQTRSKGTLIREMGRPIIC